MTNEVRLAEIQSRSSDLKPTDVRWLLQLILEYDARIAAYELEIKELKKRRMDTTWEALFSRPMGGPPPGSTHLSDSQYTLAARIGRGEEPITDDYLEQELS